MTVIAVVADPPREGLVLPELAETSPLTEREAADLYAAMLMDVVVAVDRSGGDLLVNYRPDDLLPEEFVGETSAEADVRALVETALGDASDVRFEVQVGSTFDARVGNTVTHLLEREEARSAAVVRGNAPFLFRTGIDSAAMKLRSSEVVLGPATDGRVYYAGFADTIDFSASFAPPEMLTLTESANDAGHATDFLPMQPVVERGADLATLVTHIEARETADRVVPQFTAGTLAEIGLDVDVDDGTPSVVAADR